MEFSSDQLKALCTEAFREAEIRGIFGSERYLELVAAQRKKLDVLLARDPLRLRRWVPLRVKQQLYDRRLTRERAGSGPREANIEPGDFRLESDGVDAALDLVAICRARGAPGYDPGI